MLQAPALPQRVGKRTTAQIASLGDAGLFAFYFNEPTFLPFPQIFGIDVEGLAPGDTATFDAETLGFPLLAATPGKAK